MSTNLKIVYIATIPSVPTQISTRVIGYEVKFTGMVFLSRTSYRLKRSWAEMTRNPWSASIKVPMCFQLKPEKN